MLMKQEALNDRVRRRRLHASPPRGRRVIDQHNHIDIEWATSLEHRTPGAQAHSLGAHARTDGALS
jgi:hypothetical protein